MSSISTEGIILIFSNNTPYKFKISVVLLYAIYWSPNWRQVSSPFLQCCYPIIPIYPLKSLCVVAFIVFYLYLTFPRVKKNHNTLCRKHSMAPVSFDLSLYSASQPPLLQSPLGHVHPNKGELFLFP